MNDFLQRYGEWALVAGAADGIGAAFSETLAGRGMNLVMSDNNVDLLNEFSSRIEKTYKIKTRLLHEDLSAKGAWKNCMDAIASCDCRLLVYVPSYSPVRRFLNNEERDLDLFLDLNCRTPLKLCHAFGNKMKNEKSSGIILVSSLAGLIAPVWSAVYAGTKAFSIQLAQSLNAELKEHAIDVTVCCAGITDTSTFHSSGPVMKAIGGGIMDPAEVADYAIKNLGKKAICIPGWKNRMIYFFLTRLISRNTASSLVNHAMRKIYGSRGKSGGKIATHKYLIV